MQRLNDKEHGSVDERLVVEGGEAAQWCCQGVLTVSMVESVLSVMEKPRVRVRVRVRTDQNPVGWHNGEILGR